MDDLYIDYTFFPVVVSFNRICISDRPLIIPILSIYDGKGATYLISKLIIRSGKIRSSIIVSESECQFGVFKGFPYRVLEILYEIIIFIPLITNITICLFNDLQCSVASYSF